MTYIIDINITHRLTYVGKNPQKKEKRNTQQKDYDVYNRYQYNTKIDLCWKEPAEKSE
jgi:hypothetical protein